MKHNQMFTIYKIPSIEKVLRLKKDYSRADKIDGAHIQTCLGCADSLA